MIEIAIDGTAASGKGTLGRNLSVKYGFPHLDTGLMFRAIAFKLLSQKKKIKNLEWLSCEIAKDLDLIKMNAQELRSEETGSMASKIANFFQLREILKCKQIEFANINKQKYGGCILDGRDIGTVILPNADFKFFITASIEIRAKRRLLEKNISYLQDKDVECMLQSLIKGISLRDKSDKNRLLSPMVPAKDAFVIDTSLIDADNLMSTAIKIIEGKI